MTESLGLREDRALRKEVFRGVEIHFVYNQSDDEFSASLRILYLGQRIRSISGEDLVELSIACPNQMLRDEIR